MYDTPSSCCRCHRGARVLPALALLAALAGCSATTDIGATNPDCDPIMSAVCGLPWPSNLYLAADATRATGYTLTFGPTSLPQNAHGVSVNPAPYKRLDGYSVGTPLIVLFPNLDISAMAQEGSIAQSLAADAQLVWLEVSATGVRRVPYFVELDADEPDPSRRTLFVRAAEILKEATRYVVAFRNLKDTSGATIAPSPAFTLLASGNGASVSVLSGRQARFNDIFNILQQNGLPRGSLTLAWDFVTASGAAEHNDLLSMRDGMLAQVAQSPLKLVVDPTQTKVYTLAQDANIALQLGGTVVVPSYLKAAPSPTDHTQINRDARGMPLLNGTRTIPFYVMFPQAALSGPPQGLVMYGHGLLGDGTEVYADYNRLIANQHNLIYFATDLTGMSSSDVPYVLAAFADMSAFVTVAERLQQGMVQWVALARAVRDSLGALPDVTSRHIKVNAAQLNYSGISQGGIFGGTFMALTPDITYGHLGVAGNNYSLLLQRSRDFTGYFGTLMGTYRETIPRNILLSLMQLLWDSTDPVTHLRHVTAEPYPGSNGPHYVLIAPARGDQQVAPVSNEILARTPGMQIPIMQNYDTQRTPYGVTPVSYPRAQGSGIVLYDFGNPWAWPGNRPPDTTVTPTKACQTSADCALAQECDMTSLVPSMQCAWMDPHESPRRNALHNDQMVNFFDAGTIKDVCSGHPCTPN